jgi:hypothetical protein
MGLDRFGWVWMGLDGFGRVWIGLNRFRKVLSLKEAKCV